MRRGVRGSPAKGKNTRVHVLNTQRFLKGITLWEVGKNGGGGRDGDIPPGSQPNFVCSPENIHANRKGNNSPCESDLILAGTENVSVVPGGSFLHQEHTLWMPSQDRRKDRGCANTSRVLTSFLFWSTRTCLLNEIFLGAQFYKTDKYDILLI